MNCHLKHKMETHGFRLTSIDLFSGPGGLATGFKWAGILPLIAVEWTSTTAQTYSQNHYADILELSKYKVESGFDSKYLDTFCIPSDKSVLIHGDINLVTNEMIQRLLSERFGIDSINETVDIVSGGAPCESFSMAGQRKAGDERDDLFSNICRIARFVRSKAIIFENVKGMFSKSKDGVKGAIFKYICDSFDDESQEVSYKLMSRDPEKVLLRACDYGVPQMRERLFLVSIRRDLDHVNYDYPKPEYGPGKKHPYVCVRDAISDLPLVESGEECLEYRHRLLNDMNQTLVQREVQNEVQNEEQRRFLDLMRGFKIDGMNSEVPFYLKDVFDSLSTLTCHKGPGHLSRKLELLRLIPERGSMKSTYDDLVANGEIDKYRHLFPNTIYGSRNRRLIDDQPSYTITSHCLDEMIHPHLNRAITPREAARLQSFPDWYYFVGPYVQFHGSKEEDKYEQIGDAIPPLLAYALGKEFIKCLANN